MVPRLFRRVAISRTKLDRDRFFNIAQTPTLRCAVQELIWYELAPDESVFFKFEEETEEILLDEGRYLRRYLPAEATSIHGDNAPFDFPPFASLAHNAFWWTPNDYYAGYSKPYPLTRGELAELERSREAFLADFLPRFYSALDNMPGIHTFVSSPMPPLRVVSNEGYPLTAQSFQRYGWPARDMNAGFRDFLLPAMRRSRSTIKRLSFVSEELSSEGLPPPLDSTACRNLTHIALCLETRSWLDSHFEGLHSCLRAASGLEDLRICLEITRGQSERNPAPPHPLRQRPTFDCLFGIDKTCSWPSLRTLEFTGVWARDYEADGLLRFLRAHVSTLRHLTFYHCDLSQAMIDGMAVEPHFNLDSIKITSHLSTLAFGLD